MEAYFETSSPINFPKSHDFNNALDFLITKPPPKWENEDYGDRTLLIQLPFFEDKNVLSNWYLSIRAQRAFVNRVTKFFKVIFHAQMNQSLTLGLNKKDSIEVFMEKYNLTMDSWDMLEKDFNRFIHIRHQIRWKKRLKNVVSSVSILSGVLFLEIIGEGWRVLEILERFYNFL